MKRLVLLILIIVVCLGAVSCKGEEDEFVRGPIKVAATTFAAYDWARSVAGDRNVEITLIGGGADLHSFDPSAEDILTVSDCHLLIYTGGESDSWVEDVERRSGSRTINMLQTLGDQVYREHDHDAPDEHLWMSINNAHIIMTEISGALSAFDNEGYLEYDDNREQASLKLNALDAQYKAAVTEYSLPSVIVADRFAIAYMLDYYRIVWYAAFSSCSTDVEASFATVTQLAQTVDRLGAEYIIIAESSDGAIADTVIESTKAKTCKKVVIDTMQSATEKDSYLDIMTKNLEALKLALIEDTE